MIAAAPLLSQEFGHGMDLSLLAEGDKAELQALITTATAAFCHAAGVGKAAQTLARIIFKDLGIELPHGVEPWQPVGHQLFEARQELLADLREACGETTGLLGQRGSYCDPRFFFRYGQGAHLDGTHLDGTSRWHTS